jgi:hypothetical protein
MVTVYTKRAVLTFHANALDFPTTADEDDPDISRPAPHREK